MDSQVQKFLREEKQTSTDRAHKCVAKTLKNWLLKIRIEKDPDKLLPLSEEQDIAIIK